MVYYSADSYRFYYWRTAKDPFTAASIYIGSNNKKGKDKSATVTSGSDENSEHQPKAMAA